MVRLPLIVETSSPTIERMIKKAMKGKIKRVLDEVEIILDSDELTEIERIDYLLMKLEFLRCLGHHSKLYEIIDDVKENVHENGTELQKLDFLLRKTYFLQDAGELFLKKYEIIFKEIEEILEGYINKDSVPFIQRRAVFLVTKANFMIYTEIQFHPYKELLDEAIRLSKKIDFKYGIALANAEYSGISNFEGKKIEYIDILKKSLVNYKKIGNKFRKMITLFNIGSDYCKVYKRRKGMRLIRKAHRFFKKAKAKSMLARSHHSIGDVYWWNYSNSDKAIKHYKISSQIAQEIGFEYKVVEIHQALGMLYCDGNEYSKALSHLEKGFALTQDRGDDFSCLVFQKDLGTVHIRLGDLSKAIKILEMTLDKCIENNYEQMMATLRSRLTGAYIIKGDLDKALKYSISAAKFYEKFNNFYTLSQTHRYIGDVYRSKKKFDLALEYYKRSLEAAKTQNFNTRIAEAYFAIVVLYLEHKDTNNAQNYVSLLEQLSTGTREIQIESRKLLSKALLSKSNKDIIVKLEAKKLFEDVIKIKDLDFELKVLAILNLCELLLLELKTTDNPRILSRLSELSEELHKKSILEKSFSLIAQTLWIQSQIALLGLNITKARILMDRAQSIAEEKEFDKLAMKISNAHDSLLNQLDLWESMTTELTTIAEKLELTHIETIIEEMIKGKGVILEEPVKIDEKPILLFISSKTGSILYSEQFETKLEKKIVNQILPKIMSKSKERLISESTDRAVFEEYNYLYKKIEDISFYYLFIGKSYEGIKKLEKFSEQILKTKEIWDALVSASLAEQSLDSSQRIRINRYVDRVFQEG